MFLTSGTRKKLFLSLLVTASLGACKKEQASVAPSRTYLLTAKNWRKTAWTITSGSAAPTDVYAQLPACERDDFYKFNADKSLVRDAGATRCNMADPQTRPGTWNFNSDQTVLTLADASGNSPAANEVLELSATTLHLRTSRTSGTTTSTGDITFTAF